MRSTRHLRVDLPPGMDIAASLRPLARWGDDGLDRWDGSRLIRTLRVESIDAHRGGRVVAFLAWPVLVGGRQALDVELEEPLPAATASRAILAGLLPSEESRAALAALAARDVKICALVDRYPGLAPLQFRDPFTALVRSISAQQVNLRWAAEIRRRLAAAYGRRHTVAGEHVHSLAAAAFIDAGVAALRALQLTTAKATSLLECAHAARAGALELSDLATLEDERVIARLTSLRGIGRWSAEWFLARTLGRPRVVAGDLGVRKAVGRLYLTGALPTEDQVRRLTEHWGAAAGLAQALALHDLAESASAR